MAPMGKQLDDLLACTSKMLALQHSMTEQIEALSQKIGVQSIAFDHSMQFMEERLSAMDAKIDTLQVVAS